jgi:hypothetical protein
MGIDGSSTLTISSYRCQPECPRFAVSAAGFPSKCRSDHIVRCRGFFLSFALLNPRADRTVMSEEILTKSIMKMRVERDSSRDAG